MTRPSIRPSGTLTARADVRRYLEQEKDHYGHAPRTLDPERATKMGVVRCSYWTRSVTSFGGDERGGSNVEYGVMLPAGADIVEADLVRVTDRQAQPVTPWLEVDRIEEHNPSHLIAWAIEYGR